MPVISYHGLPAFRHYVQPESIGQVISLLEEYGEGAKILAGGTDLIVQLRTRGVRPECLIDVNRIPGLDHIQYDSEEGGPTLRIGPLATLQAVEESALVREKFTILHESVRQMAVPEIRNMGTVAGNLCRASPAADTAPPLLVLKASVQLAGNGRAAIVPLERFFTGPGQTILKNEMLTEIRVPELPADTATAFLRVTRVAVDLAKVNVAVSLDIRQQTCREARIALGSVAPTPMRAPKAEAFLLDRELTKGVIGEAARIAAEEASPIDDLRSTREYRKELVRVLTRRALTLAVGGNERKG